MHSEKTLFELQSKVETVSNLSGTIHELKELANSSLQVFNWPSPHISRIVFVNDHTEKNRTVDCIAGSTVFEQWVEDHLKPALQMLTTMAVHEAHTLYAKLHDLTKPENPGVNPSMSPGMVPESDATSSL